jgi:hypothetical protein
MVLAMGTISAIKGLILSFLMKTMNKLWHISLIVTAIDTTNQDLFDNNMKVIGIFRREITPFDSPQ